MPDDRIFDAINLFKYSGTGRGTASIGGGAAYRARYRHLAERVLAKLWQLHRQDEIGWSTFSTPGLIGNSQDGRAGCDIRVTSAFRPSSDSATYATANHQSRLAATSCNIVHEAVHLTQDINSYPEEEVLCRTIQLFYFRELAAGRTYSSRVTGTELTARYLPTTRFHSSYQARLVRLASRDLIDNVFNIEEYRRDLEEDHTAAFIARSLPWWNGLNNRWPSTRGYYLRSLASQGTEYATQILQILESIPAARWPAARSCAGDSRRIRTAIGPSPLNPRGMHASRISRIEGTLRERFTSNAR